MLAPLTVLIHSCECLQKPDSTGCARTCSLLAWSGGTMTSERRRNSPASWLLVPVLSPHITHARRYIDAPRLRQRNKLLSS